MQEKKVTKVEVKAKPTTKKQPIKKTKVLRTPVFPQSRTHRNTVLNRNGLIMRNI